jgi:DNA-binding CsgD family transcriptional regulator
VLRATLSRARADLGEKQFAQARAEGARMTLDEAAAYVRRSRGARGRAKRGWGSLTPTELDVARLAAEGLSNPQIASRLLMSRGTVKTHLAHVYEKLGVANRMQLSAIAARRAQGEARPLTGITDR